MKPSPDTGRLRERTLRDAVVYGVCLLLVLVSPATSAVAAASHWSLTPLAKPAVPVGKRNPIDAFVSTRLLEAQIKPSAEADRRTLIRRLSYDLTGLPPTPEEVDAFLSSQDPRGPTRTW